jgi:glycerol uptake facilitator-like aquaporin
MTRPVRLITELVGTFIFLSVIALSGPAGSLAPLAIGTALMAMVYIFQAVAVEIVFTAALMLVVLAMAATKATEGNSFYGLAIGFTIMAAIFTGGPICGRPGSVRPWRTAAGGHRRAGRPTSLTINATSSAGEDVVLSTSVSPSSSCTR